ncbi:MAG TPA: hypothetical protein VGE09_06520 [Pseudoxanthomonas sp.]
MPDFDWIPEIPESQWIADAGGGHHLTTTYARFAATCQIPADTDTVDLLRAFDAWKHDQPRSYELFVAPPPGTLRLVRGGQRQP